MTLPSIVRSKPKPAPLPKKGKQPIPRTSPKKRKKKSPRQILVRDLDKVVREIVLDRDPLPVHLIYKLDQLPEQEEGETSVDYTKTGVKQNGHIISRAKVPVRWDLYNCHVQDAADNLLHEFYPEVYITWFIQTFGLPKWEELVNDSRKVWKYSIDDLETLYIELIEIQKKQQSDPSWKPYFTQKQILSGEWRKELS